MPAPRYHHGDLRSALVREASAMLKELGLEGLTLRKLAERAEVTPPALYHHFRDKNDLLCALAEGGFAELDQRVAPLMSASCDSLEQRLSRFVHAYVAYAAEQPERYDLMFGRTIWKVGTPTESLRVLAYATFRKYVEHVAALIGDGTERANVLRVAQASWAMLHGLCRLRIDGIYVDSGDLDAMADEAVRFVLGRLGRL